MFFVVSRPNWQRAWVPQTVHSLFFVFLPVALNDFLFTIRPGLAFLVAEKNIFSIKGMK